MAIYKDIKCLDVCNKESEGAFTKEFKPGDTPDHSGIFRCKGCGREVVAETSRTLPPQNHHQHNNSQGEVRWKMIVFADRTEK